MEEKEPLLLTSNPEITSVLPPLAAVIEDAETIFSSLTHTDALCCSALKNSFFYTCADNQFQPETIIFYTQKTSGHEEAMIITNVSTCSENENHSHYVLTFQ